MSVLPTPEANVWSTFSSLIVSWKATTTCSPPGVLPERLSQTRKSICMTRSTSVILTVSQKPIEHERYSINYTVTAESSELESASNLRPDTPITSRRTEAQMTRHPSNDATMKKVKATQRLLPSAMCALTQGTNSLLVRSCKTTGISKYGDSIRCR
ncbi:unnamed protein product [Phytophthora fragariaefolia]|uniref:Unnamed protein product n=1 Tax=Phytophthora fragariaefolia TaxID=1490495 RepID=A0A9W6XK46_9STRA|nr:unnamed protein product [Phytophthora fragariaefolia]